MKHIHFRILAVFIALLFCAASLTGCVVIDLGDSSAYSDEYDDSSKYIAADGDVKLDGNIKRLYIYWTSGDVSVETHSDNAIILSETASSTLDERICMHYYLNDGTLFVRFAASGRHRTGIPDKSLTVRLPIGTNIDEIEISSTSADIKADGISANEIDINTLSGKIDFSNIKAAESLYINVTSGKVDGNVVGKTEDVNIDTVSGKVSLSLEASHSIDVDTTSGNVEISSASAPSEIEFDYVSGDLTLRLPGDSGFNARLKTVSGVISSDFPTKITGSHCIFGDGALKIDADSVSGNIYIRSND